MIITISNKMLKKRYKASTHFNNFILSLLEMNKKSCSFVIDSKLAENKFIIKNSNIIKYTLLIG